MVQDEMMVCKYNDKGTIMVYDREFKYVRRIEHENLGGCLQTTIATSMSLTILTLQGRTQTF